ncbi:MAG: cobalamin-binding protein [Candidatus Aminicenantes bacterium]|nr:cobalamin-binding protein [Candidatus Aminicenantes bacterium]RLE01623.1 MAG: cobalamin-binding protein [Candidatus Aminicenantes bacterium]RLE04000.1 MAG: cobalamin-binding protein [Candidatus Aminicenantes bacterium]HHF42749.1 cobalamin-binding protein [Candidatus Aminicenantes bacterium]
MIFGFLKSAHDAHTLGLNHVSQLLQQCGYPTFVASMEEARAVDYLEQDSSFVHLKNWLHRNKITHLGFSYRLDPHQGLNLFERLIWRLNQDPLLSPAQGGQIKQLFFAGLPPTCELVKQKFGQDVITFQGDESPRETLTKLGVPENIIPRSIKEGSQYDEIRLSFGQKLIREEKHLAIKPFPHLNYPDYGLRHDHLIKRLKAAYLVGRLPLFRAHVGPYHPDRERALSLFSTWLKKLSQSRFLDIVSVGSSQLSQSHFGLPWDNLPNGGGVPYNNEFELRAIQEDARPMLVRAYSATNRIPQVARILEENLNMAWHALSLWWFNQLDGRGPLSLKEGLAQHYETIKYIASVNKPFEPNTPHHFAFRGSDDLTYVATAYLAAKTAKLLGIKYLVLQNMLNTPRSTWGIRDLIKGRTLLRLVRSLAEPDFRIIYQPRAGLDYFSPDLDKARAQLAAVTALMQDMEPDNPTSPEIIHVVSYSEAQFLATPEIINESIQITRAALQYYPEFKDKEGLVEIILSPNLQEETEAFFQEARLFIQEIEKSIPDLYTPEGLFQAFRQGYFPVPYLWGKRQEFPLAVNWTTRLIDGGIFVVDERGEKMTLKQRLERIKATKIS